jgi:hypothetical protein
LSH